jgi:hypothetical protein
LPDVPRGVARARKAMLADTDGVYFVPAFSGHPIRRQIPRPHLR